MSYAAFLRTNASRLLTASEFERVQGLGFRVWGYRPLEDYKGYARKRFAGDLGLS